MIRFRSDCCKGEKCWCGEDAVAKVREHIFFDDPNQNRHEFTAYICEDHFVQLMGPAAAAKTRPVETAS